MLKVLSDFLQNNAKHCIEQQGDYFICDFEVIYAFLFCASSSQKITVADFIWSPHIEMRPYITE